MANAANEWIKARMREINAKHNRCTVKGCTRKRLEWAHVKKTPLSGEHRGRKERYYDILTHPKAYRRLCHFHHFKLKKHREMHSRICKEAHRP